MSPLLLYWALGGHVGLEVGNNASVKGHMSK